MGNTLQSLKDGDILRKCLASYHNKLKFIKTINRQNDDRFAVEGAKNGGTLLIRNPVEYEVTDGPTLNVQDTVETSQTFTVATQKHVGVNFSSLERTMDVDDFVERYVDPAMSKLAAMTEYTVLSGVYKDVFNLSGTPATTPASILSVLNAGVKLSQGLAPESDRHLLFDSLAMAGTVNSVGQYIHKASELEKAFSEGYIGSAAGFKWWESNMIPNHTNGTRTDATPIVPDLSVIANGDSSLVTTGQTSGQTLKAGDIFTISGVYAVNRETKQRYSHLQQFVITADLTCDATDTFSIAPTIYKSGARQNVYHATWTGSGTIVHVAAGGSGAASQIYPQNLAYHRDAFSFVSANLYKAPGQPMTSATIEGISMRYWKGTDIINDKFPERLDVLFGYKTLRPEWAVRVRG